MFHEMCVFNFKQALRNPPKFGVPIFYFVWFLCLQKNFLKNLKKAYMPKQRPFFKCCVTCVKKMKANIAHENLSGQFLHKLFKRFFRDQPGLIKKLRVLWLEGQAYSVKTCFTYLLFSSLSLLALVKSKLT